MIGELENRQQAVPVTFSFRGGLDIRHRLPDRSGQGVVPFRVAPYRVEGVSTPQSLAYRLRLQRSGKKVKGNLLDPIAINCISDSLGRPLPIRLALWPLIRGDYRKLMRVGQASCRCAFRVSGNIPMPSGREGRIGHG